MPPDFSQMQGYLELSWDGHQNHPQFPEKSVRRHDGVTPYAVHPRLAADLLMSETSLPLEVRWLGWRVLVLHDLIEDTTLALPTWVPSDVKQLVVEMTFSSFAAEVEEIWARSPMAQLLKLYDKTTNLLDGSWMDQRGSSYRRRYENFAFELAEVVQRRWGELSIIAILEAIRRGD